MTRDFFDLSYLSKGSAIQQAGFRAITDSDILNSLKEFSPVVVGTLPLDLFISTSDIDIICYFSDLERFESQLKHSTRKDLNGITSVISNFDFDGFEFEIVGQPIPVREQFAYRHMVIEWDILEEKGEVFRREIISLKERGIKTEPAFAQLLNLPGDPYLALLEYTPKQRRDDI
ncbi:MAG: DUF4269 domain-containing protein [Bacteroidota bacterium]